MRIDHVLWAASDLEAATRDLEGRLGVARAGGGRHEGLGTHNAILPLGGGYLEVLAIADAGEAASSPLGIAVGRRLTQGDGLMGWAVVVDDVAAHAERLGTPIVTIARPGFRARLTGVGEAAVDPWRPFFLQRDEGTPDPGEPGDAGGITWVEVATGPATLADWLGATGGLPVRHADRGHGLTAVGIGDRELR